MGAGAVAIVGAGTIGTGWAMVFAKRGWRVQLYDPVAVRAQNAAAAVDDVLRAASDCPADVLAVGRCMRAETLEHALAGVDFVQESAPDDLVVKRELLAAIAARAPANAPIASSTSAFRPSDLLQSAHERRRLLVGHPFHPVELIPLVEVVGSPDTRQDVLARSTQIYEGLGKVVIHLKRECTGHLVNRLQAALFREATHLVAQGVATVQDIDRGIAFGPALRWPLTGVFTTWHLAGGPGGVRDYMEHLAPSIELLWRSLGDARLSPEVRALIEQQVIAGCGGRTPQEMAIHRDKLLGQLTDWLTARGPLV